MTIKAGEHLPSAKSFGDAGDLEDPDDNEPLVRGADGEYGMTRGKTTGQLKVKQKDLGMMRSLSSNSCKQFIAQD